MKNKFKTQKSANRCQLLIKIIINEYKHVKVLINFFYLIYTPECRMPLYNSYDLNQYYNIDITSSFFNYQVVPLFQ